MFSPLTEDMEQRRKLMENALPKELILNQIQNCDDLIEYWFIADRIRNGVICKMQLYVLDNYEKVPIEVWNEWSFKIQPHTSSEELIFGKEDEFIPNFKNSKRLMEYEKERYDKSIKIEKINFTLDEIDGDFSVDFNDGCWSFIDEEVKKYYTIIKNYLND